MTFTPRCSTRVAALKKAKQEKENPSKATKQAAKKKSIPAKLRSIAEEADIYTNAMDKGSNVMIITEKTEYVQDPRKRETRNLLPNLTDQIWKELAP